ncbi:U-box domain-containing protein 35-like isoform X2 [Impatiens glandulifera]|uniref:U-box domain-containing protein 35-like isoform X2 n=1 Tax=Impatiens glandulifera TaxID=253017 RepID=UPI001FB0A5C6|nr:U-box domain-containing protein 35-like isoform X2 [Impatiens glandulifera]
MEGSEDRDLIVAIAINGSKKSKYIVKWALEKFILESNFMVKLLHVRPKITGVPTPMGNLIPVSSVRDDVVTAYRQDVEWQTSEKLMPYKNMCIRNKVKVELKQIESDDIVDAISIEIKESNIIKLVIGASSRPIFSRGQDLSSKISQNIPGFCTVYVISKGKLSSLRPSDCETNESIKDDSSDMSFSTSSDSSSLQTDPIKAAVYSRFQSPPLPMQRFQALSSINQTLLHSRTNSVDVIKEREDSTSLFDENFDYGRPNSETSSFRSLVNERKSWISDRASTSTCPTECSSDSQDNLNFEMERLRIELRHVRGMYALAENEAIGASRKASGLVKRLSEEETKLKEIGIKENEAKEEVIKEKERRKSAKREIEYINDCVQRESLHRKDAEINANREAKEREKLQQALVGPLQQYQKFTWEELSLATSSFSEDLKIGIGANGTVYKCVLHHTTAAVKVLHSKDAHRNKQFQQELEVLSKTRHPHLLSLLGACPEEGLLVYEYMSNGSLEDVLFKNNNKKGSPLPWFTRFQIAWEIASALAFLHNAKPRSIIHRDLKPANILLDNNFVSKIGDVGLSTMLHLDPTTICNDTVGPVGTLCYIDPEYQRTGQVSMMSDVYAFGIVILQLLTAKPAMALAHAMETGLEDDRLSELLDPMAGQWPVEETKELAVLGLQCCEIRRRDRPDLTGKVLPILDRLKEVAREMSLSLSSVSHQPPPNHFICPILKEIMEEPCVAGDGYTYDRRAIELWLDENETSPMTNLPLLTKILLPNYTLLSAIMEWKSERK